MQEKIFYKVYLNSNYTNKCEIYNFIADLVNVEKNEKLQLEIVEKLEEREKKGGILVAESVILPHFESSKVKKSGLIFIKPNKIIKRWNNNIGNVELIIVILLRENEGEEEKKEIRDFVRKFADDSYVEQLKQIKNTEIFYQKIKK